MPVKRKSTGRKSQRGKGVAEVLGKVNELAKKTKILSEALKLSENPYAQTAASVASQLGYGRKRKAPKRRVQHGAGILDSLMGAFGTVAGGLGSGVGRGLGGLFGGLTGGSLSLIHI